MEKLEKGVGLIERILASIEKYKITTILKAVVILLIIAGAIGFISNPTFIFEQYKKWEDDQHRAKIELRLQNTNKINHILDKALYKMNVDRIILLECHNGLNGLGGLPFAKCSATFEVLGDGVYPVANQYQDANLSLMPFASYLFENGYWCGNTKELEKLDRGLYHKIASNGTEHFAACVIEGVDEPLAFLFISFNDIDENHNCQIVRENTRHLALEIALLLELGKKYN